MWFKKMFLAFAAIILLASGYSYAQNSQWDQPYPEWQGRHLTPHEQRRANGPSFSSPEVQMAPNTDRSSPYPPYYHPSPD